MGFRLCHARFSPMLRAMSGTANTVPVTILTGFLGSGKTTVLNHLLRQPSLADTVVIVNEFGAVGLDHLLIEQAIEDAVLLKNGCICCTVRGDIADTLDVLWQRRDAGELPPFRRIAIETTGLADPAPVAHALLAEPGARYACRLDGIVTTVDALHGPMQFERQPEARRQVAMADRILLTKTDLADAAQIAESEARIRALNASAPLRHVVAGAVDAADVFGLGPDSARLEQWLRPLIMATSTCRSGTAMRSDRWCCVATRRSHGRRCNVGWNQFSRCAATASCG
jgi:G3E family GTPase